MAKVDRVGILTKQSGFEQAGIQQELPECDGTESESILRTSPKTRFRFRFRPVAPAQLCLYASTFAPSLLCQYAGPPGRLWPFRPASVELVWAAPCPPDVGPASPGRYLSSPSPSILLKTPFWDTGVSEKNDARRKKVRGEPPAPRCQCCGGGTRW